uniref:Reverse transcriptase domain-containing protein n=1 Tax=Oncorhynchus mykiss TaxID=8022 RepID=A0A8K9UWL6_ONCMY
MGKTREYSNDVRPKVVELHKSGNGYKKIAQRLKMPISTIRAIIKKFKATGDVNNRPGRGRVSILTPRTVRRMVCDHKISKDHSWRIADVSWDLGSESLQNYDHTNKLFGRVAIKKAFGVIKQLTQAPTVCQNVTGTFNGTGFNGQMRPTYSFCSHAEKYLIPFVKYGGGSLMSWCFFSSKGPGQLVRIHGIMDSINYQQMVVVRVGNNISSPLILNTGAPQGCVLSPLLYSLFTHDCVATHASNSIIKFADDTTVVGLITNNDETAYREEVRALGVWCQENNLTLNVNKTKEMIVDFRKQQREHPPIHIDGTVVERVASFKFLGIHITDKLNWSTHTDSIVKKAQQRLFNLRRLKKFGLSPKALTNFYRCTIESILAGCITAWYGNCTALNRKALQRVVRSAQRITGGKLPALQDTYTTRCHRKAIKIIKDINHPSHCMFTPLSSRRRGQYRCIKAGTERLKNSFYLKAIRLLSSHHLH